MNYFFYRSVDQKKLVTLVDAKEGLRANLAMLEKEGLCKASDNYQDILNSMAKVREEIGSSPTMLAVRFLGHMQFHELFSADLSCCCYRTNFSFFSSSKIPLTQRSLVQGHTKTHHNLSNMGKATKEL